MSIKLILMDLDGTLLTSDKNITARTMDTLNRASQAGITIVPCTGRFYDGMPQIVRDLPFVHYVITVNGAQIYDVQKKEVLHRAEITPENACLVYNALDRLPVIYDSFINGWGYMDNSMYQKINDFITDPCVNRMVRDLRMPVPSLKEYVHDNNLTVQKIQMFFQDMNQRQIAWNALTLEFPQMSVTSSISNNLELNDIHANKGEALDFLARHLGIERPETMSFGDGSNDLSMIKAAGIGVAMANAGSTLKESADFITDTNDQDGIAKAIENFCFC